jgi:uncharacterized protein YuzE
MKVLYDDKADLLYLRLDETRQPVMNRRVTQDIVLDLGEEGRIVGIEILEASKHVNLKQVLPVGYEVVSGVR